MENTFLCTGGRACGTTAVNLGGAVHFIHCNASNQQPWVAFYLVHYKSSDERHCESSFHRRTLVEGISEMPFT